MRYPAITGLSSLTLGLVAAVAFAHAFPKHASPGAGARLSKAPAQVHITFDAGLEPAFSTLKVKNAQGDVVSRDSRVAPHDDKLLEAKLPALKPGKYHVYWRVVALDSHRTEGDYTFTVKP
jgi:methionine-rich copper-binding protein CopC